MDTLTTNPFFQSGILPFAVALAAALALRPMGWRWSGLGFAVGFIAAVYFINGLQITPFTSTRKILLLTCGAVLVGLLLDLLHRFPRVIPFLVAPIAAAAAAWLIWPVVSRLEGAPYWQALGLSLAYVAWVVTWAESLRSDRQRAAACALSLGVGTSISAVLGASALLGQLSGAVAAAVGAFTLLLVLNQKIAFGSNFILPVAMATALCGLAGVHYASMSSTTLIALALIPLFARLPLKKDWHPSINTLIVHFYSLPPAAVAIYITWRLAGDAPF